MAASFSVHVFMKNKTESPNEAIVFHAFSSVLPPNMQNDMKVFVHTTEDWANPLFQEMVRSVVQVERADRELLFHVHMGEDNPPDTWDFKPILDYTQLRSVSDVKSLLERIEQELLS